MADRPVQRSAKRPAGQVHARLYRYKSNQTIKEPIMKIYISADIEGITDVTHSDETDLQKGDSYAPASK